MASARQRPDPVRWLWYALGGRLPDRYREWVWHDVTTSTWLWRHGVRTTFLVGPISAVWLLLPGPLGLRLSLVLLAVLVGYFYSFAFAEENAEHRVTKYGYSYGSARKARSAARMEEQADVQARYLALYRDQD